MTETEPKEAFTDVSGVRHGDRALVLNPVLKSDRARRIDDGALEETIGLANAIDLQVILAATVNLTKTIPATLFGKGQVENFGQAISDNQIVLVVVNHELTPIQQRNLETRMKCKVID